MQVLALKAIPTYIISGFLGAGKTTLLNTLLAQKPAGEVWAILQNETGHVALEAHVLHADESIVIKQSSGGCACCVGQLPMQIALTHLLHRIKALHMQSQQARPVRLLIELSGLAHVPQVIAQLSQGHWQTSLSVQAVLGVMSRAMLLDQRYWQHRVWQGQMAAADALLITQAATLTPGEQQALQRLLSHYPQLKHSHYVLEQAGRGEATTLHDAAADHRVSSCAAHTGHFDFFALQRLADRLASRP